MSRGSAPSQPDKNRDKIFLAECNIIFAKTEKYLNNSAKVSRLIIVEIALILVVSALAYLPNINQAGYYRDDWYYMLDRFKGGPGVFQSMFAIDRPARGPLLEAYYSLFGLNPPAISPGGVCLAADGGACSLLAVQTVMAQAALGCPGRGSVVYDLSRVPLVD